MTFLSFLKFLLICLEVVVFFNLMIIVHELGHFLAARWRGLVIEKFGIWFGKPIWQKKINGVVYSLGSIPAGGFVALPQLAPMEVMEGEVESDRSQLPPISVLDKIIVAFAGPLFSFLLAAVFAVAIWQVGRPVSEAEASTVIGFVEPDSAAAKAGLRAGDKILRVDGQPVTRFGGMGSDAITWRIVRSEGKTVPIEVERVEDGKPVLKTFEPVPEVPDTKVWNRKGLRQISILPMDRPVAGQVLPGTGAAEAGVKPGDILTAANGRAIYRMSDFMEVIAKAPAQPIRLTVERAGESVELPPLSVVAARIHNVLKGLPAHEAGLKPGDRVVAINGQPVVSSIKLSELVRNSAGTSVKLAIERGGKPTEVELKPAQVEGETKPMIGVQWEDDLGILFDPRGHTTLVHPGPFEQIRAGVMSIFNTLGAITARKSDVKLQHMGGPVMMMQVYYRFFQMDFADGWRLAFWFSVVLNVNLAMINLLPIPVLDGGHITLALIEGIRRRPVNVRVLEFIQTGCAVMIIGFMLYIAFFDVQDLFGGSGPKRQRSTPVPAEQGK